MVLNVSPSKSPCLLNIRQHIYLCLSLCPTAVLPNTLIMTSSNENSQQKEFRIKGPYTVEKTT